MKKQSKKPWRFIPFWLLPASWGLSGESREIAEAEYYLDGYDLKNQLIAIKYVDPEKTIKMLDLDYEYGKLDFFEYQESLARETLSGRELDLRLAELEWQNKKLDDREYDKKVATIKNEAYINIDSVNSDGSFEFDWNDVFIEELEQAGYGPHPKQEQTVDEWFNEVCKNITLEQYQGDIGLLDEQIEERKNNLVEVTRTEDGKKEIK